MILNYAACFGSILPCGVTRMLKVKIEIFQSFRITGNKNVKIKYISMTFFRF